MYRYKRLLVNLTLNESDKVLIEQAHKIAKMAESEKVYFQYTEKKMNIPEELVKEYPQLTESAADFARDKIAESVNGIFNQDNGPETMIFIQEGVVLDEMLKQIRINGIDLVLVGVSDEDSDSKDLATKLARKASCSVLAVPLTSELDLQRSAVAIDFSDNSAYALDSALAFVRADNIEELQMFHVYQVPSGFYKTGKSYDEFADIMKTHAEKEFGEFSKQFNTSGISIAEHYLLSSKTVDAIENYVKENKITFLVLGARGRSAGASIMLGSVTEKLMNKLNIPILAVKKKGSGLNLLDVLFN